MNTLTLQNILAKNLYVTPSSRIRLKFHTIYSTIYSTISTIDNTNNVHSFEICNSFAARLKFVRLIVHSNYSLPRTSKQYSDVIQLANPMLFFRVKYVKIFIRMLGYPYEKFTCSERKGEYGECMESCAMNQSISKFNKVLHDIDIFKRYDYKHISKIDSADPKISDKIYDIFSSCWNTCIKYNCKFDYAITSYHYDVQNGMVFLLESPSFPYLWIIFYPRLELLDLTVYVMGATGAWFGVTFINLNPISIIDWIKGRYPRQDQQFYVWRRDRNGTYFYQSKGLIVQRRVQLK